MKNILTILIPNAHTRDKITEVLFDIFVQPMRFFFINMIKAITFVACIVSSMEFMRVSFDITQTLWNMEASWQIFIGETLNYMFDLQYDDNGDPLF